MPEWPKGADCKSAGLCLRWFESTSLHDLNPKGNPRGARGATKAATKIHAGVAQLVELQPSKLVVEGSSPFARSNESPKAPPETPPRTIIFRPRSTVAVHFLGKEGVASSILAEGSAT